MDGKLKAILIVTFLLCFPVYGLGQDCDIPGNGSFIFPKKGCAPLDVNYKVELQGIAGGAAADVRIQFDWDDGSPIEIGVPVYDAVTDMWTVTLSHNYNVKSPQCIYEATGTPVINGTICDGSTAVQRQSVTVWDSDFYSSTGLVIAPETYTICYGNTGSVIFEDVSIWNCEPDDVPIVEGPNERKRWIQWVYGTNSGEAIFIDDALVGGSTPASFPYSGPIEETFEPIYNPEPPWSRSEEISVVSVHDIGNRFRVTLRNWNQCNPYDDPDIPGVPADPINGDNPPVETEAWVLIVAPPDGSVSAAGPFCENEPSVILTPITPGGVWSGMGIVDAATGEFDPAVAGPGIHSISYSVTDGNNCSANGSVDIEVFDAPLANITSGDETYLCPGSQLQLNGDPTEGLLPYVHAWTGDVGTLNSTIVVDPIFETVVEGSYELVYRVTDGNMCFDEDTIVMVVDSISIQFLNDEEILCTGTSQALEPNPVGGSGVFVYHQWTGDRVDLLSATDVENPDFTGVTPGRYGYKYLVQDSYGCEDSDSVYVLVHEQPVSNAGVDDLACGLEYTLAALPSVGVGEWTLVTGTGAVSFDDVTSSNSLVTVDAYGSYTFRWTEDNNNCIDFSDVQITFFQIPQPTVMNDADTCGLSHLLVANQDVGIGVWKTISSIGTVSYDDNLGGTTGVDVSLPGEYQFAWVEDNNGCIAGDTVIIDFYPVPNAIVDPFDAEQCSPAEVAFNNSSTEADVYFWDFGDGYISNQVNPIHDFVNNTFDPIDYIVELIASNSYGCIDTANYDMRVLPTAVADFSNNEEPGCSPLELDFVNESEGATSYAWDFGDGNTSIQEDVTHTFVNQEQYVQSFNVELVANNTYGCRDTLDKYITVYPLVEYGFVATPQEGCHPLKVEMVADPGAYSYKWDFDDGNILDGANVATHVFENLGLVSVEFNVKLYTSSIFGCEDSSEVVITVLPSPQSDFNLSVPEGCSPLFIDIENQSTGVAVSSWYFGDGDELVDIGSSDVSHTYINSELATKTFQPKLVVENTYGCKDSISRYLRVFPKVTAAISEGGVGCTPHLESLLNNSIGANQFTWNFGDGNVSNGFNGHNEYINSSFSDQVYDVSLIAESSYGCKDTAYTSVTVYRRPVPNFTITPLTLQMPESTISITNSTAGDAWSYYWEFGDGSTSTLKDPNSYTYGVSGEYEVWLRVSGDNCADSSMQIVQVLPTLPFIDYGPNSQGCPPLEVQFYNNTVDAYTYFWDFGDGNVSSEKEPKHLFYSPGKYNIKLQVEGPGGFAEADDVIVEVYDKPYADFEVRPTVVKLPETVSFINLSEGAISYYWQFGDGQTSTEHSLQYRYENAGVYDVILQVTNEKGCIDERIVREAVTTEEAGSISFPNAFTPNPSGSSGGEYVPGSSDNYVFYPFVHEGVTEYEMRIYTRWGELIFESKDLNIGWDGYHKGKICPSGVYIWKVRCEYSNGGLDIKTGDVTLFR